MTFQLFTESLSQAMPPMGLGNALEALWYDAQEDWDKAHSLVEDADAGADAWVHAYLHRKEGDLWNAKYWYRRAGKATATQSLSLEWEQIVLALLDADR